MISVRSVRGTPAGALIVVTVAIFTDMLLYGLVVPVLPGYAADLGISEWAIGVLFGSYSLASLVTTPVFGAFSDRVGRRVPMFCGLIGLGAATLLFASATSYPMLLTARMLQGVAAAATWTAGLALVADVFPAATRGGAMGTVLTGMTAGSLIGPPVGGLLFQWGGFRLPFIVAAAMCLLEGVLLLVLLREPPRQIHSGSGEGFRSLLRDRAMLLAAGAAIVGAAAWALLEPVLPLRLEQQFDFSPAAVGLLFGAATLVYGASAPWVGRVSDAVGRRPVMALGIVLLAVSLPVVGVPGPLVLVIAAILVLSVAYGFVLTPVLPELADIVDRRGGGVYASAYAIFNAAYSAGMMAGPMLGGALSSVVGFSAALVIAGGLVLLYLPVLLYFGGSGSRREPAGDEVAALS